MSPTLEKIAADPAAYPFDVDTLGGCKIPSPVRHHAFIPEGGRVYMDESVPLLRLLQDRAHLLGDIQLCAVFGQFILPDVVSQTVL